MGNRVTCNNRIEYIDALKFIAIISIICIHVAIIWPNANIKSFNISGFSEFCRMGVPVFLMVSGALLLNKNYDLDSFFKKRFSRIITPFVFWAIIYAAFILIIFLLSGYSEIFRYINNFPLEWSWYFWMIFAVYLAIPVVNEFILNKKLTGAKYFTLIFIIASIFYQICIIFNINSFIDLRFFLGPIGYIVLGYYLANKEFKIKTEYILIISLILFFLASIIKVGFNIFPYEYAHLVIQDSTIHLLSFMDVNICEIIQASAIFLFIKNLYSFKLSIPGKNIIKKGILSISKASYGIYLIHGLFILVITELLANIPFSGTEICILIVILTILVLAISWICILLTTKIPIVRKLSGYH